MSNHDVLFSSVLEKFNHGWELYEVYRDKLKKDMREEFWFEWFPQQTGDDVLGAGDALQQMFGDASFWASQDDGTLEKILINVHDVWARTPERRYPWGVNREVFFCLAHSIKNIVHHDPARFSQGAFDEHPQLATLLEFFKWEQGKIPFDALEEPTLEIITTHWITNTSTYDMRGRAELTSPAFIERLTARLATFSRDYPDEHISWSNVGHLLEHLEPEVELTLGTRLTFSSCTDQQIHDIVRGIATRGFPDNLDLFVARHHSAQERGLYPVSWMSLVMAELCVAHDLPFPKGLEEMLLEVVARSNALQLKLFQELVTTRPLAGLAERLEGQIARWRGSALLHLIEFVHEPREVLAQILAAFWGYSSLSKYDLAHDSSLCLDLRKLPREALVEEALELWRQDAPPREQAQILLDAVSRDHTSREAPLYLLAMHHKSKPVRELAERLITDLGLEARSIVEQGKDSKKKSVRTFCSKLLESLDAMPAEELPSDEELEAHARRVEAIRPIMRDHKKAAEFFNARRDEPMAWIHATLEVYAQQTYAYAANEVLRAAIDAYSDDGARTEEIWRAVLATMASYAHKLKKYELRYGLLVLDQIKPKRLLAEELPKLLLHASGTYAPELFKRYLKHAKHDPDRRVLLAGLTHKSKVIRDLISEEIEALLTKGPKEARPELVNTLVEALQSRSKSAREVAARALSRVDADLLTPHQEELQKAHDSERSVDVQLLLAPMLSTLGVGEGADDSAAASAAPEELSNWEAAQELLESMKSRKTPKFIDLQALPALRWSDGETALSDSALATLLTTLRQEGPDTQDPVARQVRPFLDDDSAHNFSVALKDQWKNAGSSASHKWAVYQQAILVKEERLDEFGPHLANWVSYGKHHWAKWYLDILARHGSMRGESWLVHWALNAEHRSLHEHANHLVEELASARGITPGELHASVNLYILEDAFEQDFKVDASPYASGLLADGEELTFAYDFEKSKAIVERASGKTQKSLPRDTPPDTKEKFKRFGKLYTYSDERIRAYLEQCMISGRSWSVERFEAFFLEHPFVKFYADKLLFMLGDGETFFHVHEGDLIDVDWEPLKLAEDATINIAHVHDLKGKNVDKWLAHMGEGDVIQPFAQLDRPFYEVGSEPEVPEISLATLAGRLNAQGWRSGRAEDAGMIYEASKIMPGRNVKVIIDHHGIYAGNPGMYREQTPVRVQSFHDLQGNSLDPQQVDPIAYSETWLSLTELTR